MKAVMVMVLLLLCSSAFAAEPRAVATAAKREVSVGERFTVDVQASGPPGVTFTFPPEAAQESFELRSVPAESSSVTADRHRYQVAVFALEDAQVPPIPIRYRLADGTEGEVKTAPIPMRITTLLPRAKDEQKLADVRGPVKLSVGRAFWIALIAAVVAVAALVWWIVSRRKRKPGPNAALVPALSPEEDARRALDALVASGRLARGEYRPFYIELTLIAKRYLERRLEVPIVEMTTAEMLSQLRTIPNAVALAPTLRDLTGAADQIKFARGSGLSAEAERHLTATRAMISDLEARPASPASEGGQAA